MPRRWILAVAAAVVVAAAAVAAIAFGNGRPADRNLQHLRVDLAAVPSDVLPGDDIHFAVRIRNVSDRDVLLDPCPTYTTGMELDQIDSDHATNLGPLSSPRKVDCDAIEDRTVRAGSTVTLPMTMHVPALPHFPCLDQDDADGHRACFAKAEDQPATLYWTLQARPALLRHYARSDITLRAPAP